MLKWVGGKTKVLPHILDRLPSGCERYIEPFLGGGAVFLAIGNQFKECYVSDLNPRLMNFYNAVAQYLSKYNAQPIVDGKQEDYNLYQYICQGIEVYNALETDEERENFYNTCRKAMNGNDYAWLEGSEVTVGTSSIAHAGNVPYFYIDVNDAANFYIINHLCFNGLYRENKKGEFNVPFGKYKKLPIPDADEFLWYCTCFLYQSDHQVHIGCFGYDKSLDYVNDKTFIYLDPPYRPISNTASFTAYQKSGFNDVQQKELKEFCDEVHKRGGKFLLSNSYQEDGFFQELYKDYTIDVIEVMRTISAKGDSRGATKEILVRNY